MDIVGTLKKNTGSNAVVKFFKALDGSWYLIGNGGMGSLITMEVRGEENNKVLDDTLKNEEMVFVSRDYLFEIGKEGHVYYHMPKENTLD
jgi:hypothetical protein